MSQTTAHCRPHQPKHELTDACLGQSQSGAVEHICRVLAFCILGNRSAKDAREPRDGQCPSLQQAVASGEATLLPVVPRSLPPTMQTVCLGELDGTATFAGRR